MSTLQHIRLLVNSHKSDCTNAHDACEHGDQEHEQGRNRYSVTVGNITTLPRVLG